MSKHTPGPWYGVIPSGDSPRRDSYLEISNDDGNHRATDDDFKLIAAAPDLLEALENLMVLAEDAMEQANRDGCSFEIENELKEAKAAIAKATGEGK